MEASKLKPADTESAVIATDTSLYPHQSSGRTGPPPSILSPDEVGHFHDLGLGRGIDSSDPKLWKNKSPMQIRIVNKDLSNLIGTDESGIKHRYKKTVSSLKTQQAKIQTSLSDPVSKVRIGLDAHYSQSAVSTVTINGTRVQTRTISFRYDFDDLPEDTAFDEGAQYVMMQSVNCDGHSTFENDLSVWIIRDLLQKQKIPPTPDISKLKGKTAVEKLVILTQEVQDIESEIGKAIEFACRKFVFEFGITHYVSAIELGALKYSVHTSQSYTTKGGVASNVGVSSSASVRASTDTVTEVTGHTKEEQEIGYFSDKDVVRRNTSDEAVIGFQMQPVSKLIRVSMIETAMKIAIEIYLKSKTDDSVGPFLVSTTVNKKPVYWKVNESTLIGTEDIKSASLFYVIPAGDPFYPADFGIAYWGDKIGDRKFITDLNSRLTKLRSAAPKLPSFLTTKTSIFDSSNTALVFKDTFDIKTARYTIHSRIYHSFACFTRVVGPASTQSWLDGEEFFIQHSPHFLKCVYLAIKLESGATENTRYVSIVLPNIKSVDKGNVGMLFCLHPFQYQQIAGQKKVTGTEAVESLVDQNVY